MASPGPRGGSEAEHGRGYGGQVPVRKVLDAVKPVQVIRPHVEGMPGGPEQRGVARTVAHRGDLLATDVKGRHQPFKPRPLVVGPEWRDRPIRIEPAGGPMRRGEALS